MGWEKISIDNKAYQNVSETALGILNASIENGYVSTVGSLTRFPRLNEYLVLNGDAPTYLEEWRGDLIAVTGGRTYRVDVPRATATDVTGVNVSGTGRVIFAQTDRSELLMAAGRSIIRLSGDKTTVLSEQAPESTHVAFIDGYVIAIEPRSGRFYVSRPGEYTQWDPLDVFSAEGNPDNITGMIVSGFNELFLAGPRSIEQFDSAPNGTRPFIRRWGLGTGLYAPYTLMYADNRVWGLDQKLEWTSFNAQVGRNVSDDVQNILAGVSDWSGAWASEITVNSNSQSQRFIVLQAPNALTPYGTTGLTLLYDYSKQRWSTLYGWNSDLSLPSCWEGRSFAQVGSRNFVGGNGRIYELTGHDGTVPQKMLWRSGHISRSGNQPFTINGASMRIARGRTASNTIAPLISVRINKDNRGFGRWMRGSLGRTGDNQMTLNFQSMGSCQSVQYEVQVTDNGPIDIARFEHDIYPLKR